MKSLKRASTGFDLCFHTLVEYTNLTHTQRRELKAWCITPEGRAALKDPKAQCSENNNHYSPRKWTGEQVKVSAASVETALTKKAKAVQLVWKEITQDKDCVISVLNKLAGKLSYTPRIVICQLSWKSELSYINTQEGKERLTWPDRHSLRCISTARVGSNVGPRQGPNQYNAFKPACHKSTWNRHFWCWYWSKSPCKGGKRLCTRTDLESHANMSVVECKAYILSWTKKTAVVSTYTPYYEAKEIPICDVAVTYEDPYTGNNVFLFVWNALYVPPMKKNLINSFIMQDKGVQVKDTPKIHMAEPDEDNHATVFPDTKLWIPLQVWGVFSYFPSWRPTVEELKGAEEI